MVSNTGIYDGKCISLTEIPIMTNLEDILDVLTQIKQKNDCFDNVLVWMTEDNVKTDFDANFDIFKEFLHFASTIYGKENKIQTNTDQMALELGLEKIDSGLKKRNKILKMVNYERLIWLKREARKSRGISQFSNSIFGRFLEIF